MFYCVLLCFTVFYCFLLFFTVFLLGFTGFYWVFDSVGNRPGWSFVQLRQADEFLLRFFFRFHEIMGKQVKPVLLLVFSNFEK